MSEPIWVRRETLELLHSESIAEHGGADGLRDENLFESALARPRKLFVAKGETDIARLAACYAFWLTKERAFNDGNTRIALVAAGLFLYLNEWRLIADPAQTALAVMAVASGASNEKTFTAWIQEMVRPALSLNASDQLKIAREIARERKAALQHLAKR